MLILLHDDKEDIHTGDMSDNDEGVPGGSLTFEVGVGDRDEIDEVLTLLTAF